jgi:hypothetical protein
MLKWYICKNNDLVWEGYDDGDLRYRIYYVSAVGWCWEDVPCWEGGESYDTEEEAMEAAEKHYAKRLEQEDKLLIIDLEISLEEIDEIHWDEVAHERMENAKGLQ